MPKRIQRLRTKGWRMPEGTVYVGRPTNFGNPFTVRHYYDSGFSGGELAARVWVIEQYRKWLAFEVDAPRRRDMRDRERDVRPYLPLIKGNDLACWCRLDQICHADVLLELANQ